MKHGDPSPLVARITGETNSLDFDGVFHDSFVFVCGV